MLQQGADYKACFHVKPEFFKEFYCFDGKQLPLTIYGTFKLNDSFQVIDTGSPVTQENLVPNESINSTFNLSDCCLKGINNSKLLINGIFEDIIVNVNVYKIFFYVVATNTNSYNNCLLGF